MPRGTIPLPAGAEHVTHRRLGAARVHPRRCGRRVVLHPQDRFDPRARHNAVQLAQELPVLDPLSVGQAAAPQIPATVKRIQEYSVAAHGMPRFAGPCAHGCHHVGETLRAQILTPCMLEATPHSLQARGRLESDGKPRQGATTTRLITGR